MRVLVCGGRDCDDMNAVWDKLQELAPELVIQGGAGHWEVVGERRLPRGADLIAKDWCDVMGCPCITMDAAWKGLRKAAGPIRNGWMLKYGKPDLVLAFPGGKGTADMIKQARKAGVEVKEIT